MDSQLQLRPTYVYMVTTWFKKPQCGKQHEMTEFAEGDSSVH